MSLPEFIAKYGLELGLGLWFFIEKIWPFVATVLVPGYAARRKNEHELLVEQRADATRREDRLFGIVKEFTEVTQSNAHSNRTLEQTLTHISVVMSSQGSWLRWISEDIALIFNHLDIDRPDRKAREDDK